MSYTKGRHPGATWRKTDFQIHTPRDPGWIGGLPTLPAGATQDEYRKAWAVLFVSECLKRNMSAIAITDHHDLVMLPYINDAIQDCEEARSSLWLFPGMEITCDDSVQCLILFDRGTTSDILRRLFGILPKITEPDASQNTAPQAILCGKNVDDFLAAAFEDISLRGISIVLPHARSGGHKNILRYGFHQRFANLQVDGVYNEKAFAEIDDVTLQKIYGEIGDWGDRRHGIITTGDNRYADFKSLGINECWIRLGEPTAESIRQAVLADRARITYSEPSVPSQRVLDLRVSSSLTGADFTVCMNDGFNAIIGGRGAGKSAVLEYLRFGLGRSTLDTAEEEASRRERGLISATLIDGFVEVDLERDGLRETWRRTLDQSLIEVTAADGTRIELPINQAQERFRARAFSQKQLSTLVRRVETADEQITGIAAAEWVDARRQTEQEIEAAERTLGVAFQRVVQNWAAQASMRKAKNATTDIEQRMRAVRDRLDQAGLTEQQKELLNQAPAYSRTDNELQRAVLFLTRLRGTIDAIDVSFAIDWQGTLLFPETEQSRDALQTFQAQAISLRMQMASLVNATLLAVMRNLDTFKDRQQQFKERHTAAVAIQDSLGALLGDLQHLNELLDTSKNAELALETLLIDYSTADDDFFKARTHLQSKIASLKSILNSAAARIDEMSGDILRARVEEEAIPGRFVNALLDLSERCNIRELEDRCQTKVAQSMLNGGTEWETMIHRLTAVRKARIFAGDSGESDVTAVDAIKVALGWELTENQARSLLNRLDDNRLLRLLTAWAAPFIRFEYKDRGAFMPFERASPGQQASALLTLLLNQEAGTLLIDQPEDDLDNRVIMSIVRQLQETKRRRQLIFATHNPNLVVNGDADKVIALRPSVEPNAAAGTAAAQIEIEADGAIETPTVRDSITETMEGGMKAFELRGRKYAIENPE